MKIKNELKIQKTYRFRLYPTAEQEQQLFWTLDQCRFVYNVMLDWLKTQEKPNRYALQNALPKLKELYPELKNVYSKALQYEVYRLFSNLKALSKLKKKGRKVGKLRFKGKGSFKTIHYNQSGFKIISTNARLSKLHVSKIGEIPMQMHRNVEGKIKQVIIKKHPSGKWFAGIVVEQDDMVVQKQSIRNAIGIDVGLRHFLSDSDGKRIENPHYLKTTLKRLKRRQKHLSKLQKGSKNRTKQRMRVARLHEKITNQRNDYLHKISRYYINQYDMVAIEDLNIQGMVKNHHLSQYISDVSWHRFAQMLSYKAEWAGKTIVRVNPRYTSQTYQYGKSLNRDYNASLNILQRGLKQVGMGQTEFTPVDIRPLQELVTVPASQVVESGSLLQNY